MKNNKLKQMLESKMIISLILFGAGYSIIINIILTIIFIVGNVSPIEYRKHISESAPDAWYIFSIIGVCIIAPVIEELIYRALVMKIAKRFLTFKWVNILQALIFSIAHLNIIQMVYAFILGLTMGYIYNKYETVYSTIAIHTSFNIVGYILPLFYNSFLLTSIDNIFILNIIRLLIYCFGIIIFIKSFKKIKNYNFKEVELIQN